MRRLLCIVLGRHRPTRVVTGFEDGRPTTALTCPRCADSVRHARLP